MFDDHEQDDLPDEEPTPTPTPAPSPTPSPTPEPGTGPSPPPSPTPAPSPAPSPQTVDVSATNNERFEPATISIRVGDTVRWTNTSSSLIHTVTFDASLADDPSHVELPAGADPFNSGNIAPGGTFTRTFTVPGTYRYFCIPHEDEPMVGSITVSP